MVAAHPDDECVGCGALLQRMQAAKVVFMTDGAPLAENFWKRFGSREAYAELRREEARRALAHVGASKIGFVGLEKGIADQELWRELPRAYEVLRDVVRAWKPRALLTLSYEGGHPDHDACCVLSAALGRELELPVWEMPLYHRDRQGASVMQQYVARNGSEVEIQVTADELARKQACIKEYASQDLVIAEFDVARELFRPLAAYDYAHPAHDGRLNYEIWGWPMRGVEVSAAFGEFLGKGVGR